MSARGRVLDLDGRPAAGARVAFSFLYRDPVRPQNGITETDYVFADEDGKFDYHPDNRYRSQFLIGVDASFSPDGSYLVPGVWGKTVWMNFERGIGWTQEVEKIYDPIKGWSVRLIRDENRPARDILLNAQRSGPPQQQLRISDRSVDATDGTLVAGFDALRGIFVAGACPDCDFSIRSQFCTDGTPAWFELRATAGGGVIAVDEARMGRAIAPAEGYMSALRFVQKQCITPSDSPVDSAMAELPRPKSNRPEFFFVSRGGLLRGLVELDTLQFTPDYARKDPPLHRIMLYSMVANPRGDRNLRLSTSLELPLAYSVEESSLDFGKIELREDPILETLTISGLPGALTKPCTWVSYDGHGPSNRTLGNRDGSFSLTVKARLADRAKLSYDIARNPDAACTPRSGDTVYHSIDLRRLRILSEKAKAGQPLTLLPWTDESHLDFSRIYVTEDRDKGEVTVRGDVGATPHPCTWVSIVGLRENGSTKHARTNSDGSFTLTVKGDLRELVRLYVATYPVEFCGQTNGDGQFYYLMPLKIKSEAARAALNSSTPSKNP